MPNFVRPLFAFFCFLLCCSSCLPSKPSDKNASLCSQDKDCEIYCGIMYNCCGALCSCTRAYNKTYISKAQKYCEAVHKAKSYGHKGECPQAKCTFSKYNFVARCLKNQCTAVKSKLKSLK